jgi:hypothetical protein
MLTVRNLFGSLAWIFTSAFAPALLLIGYVVGAAVVPEFHQPVSFAPPAAIWGAMLALFVLGVIGMTAEIKFLAAASTPKNSLQSDHFLSALIAMVFTGIAGFLMAKGALAWWFVPGLIYSVCDLFASGWLAVNNAFQKNPTQIQK